jgi:hypothetical protein
MIMEMRWAYGRLTAAVVIETTSDPVKDWERDHEDRRHRFIVVIFDSVASLCEIIAIEANGFSFQCHDCGERSVELVEIERLEKKAIRPSEFRLMSQRGPGH